MTRSSRTFAAIAACLSGITVVLAGVAFSVARMAPDITAVRHGTSRRPAGVDERLGRLRQALPGLGGEFGGGGYSDEKFGARAYPDDDIPLERLTNARRAFEELEARGSGSGGPSGWEFLGPTSAVYQQTFYRFSYVPSQVPSIRTHNRHGDRADVPARRLSHLDRRRGWWRVAHRQRPLRKPAMGIPLG